MTEKNSDNTKSNENKEELLQPDPETIQTPDPQDEMKGPLSSIVQNIKEAAKDDITKKEADEIKDKNL